MAQGKSSREVVQDPNAPARGNAPSQQLAVSGIQGTRGSPAQNGTGMDQALAAFGRVGATLNRKQKNADFIEGQMASMSGQTQAEVAATGNKTSMAGFVSLEVGNAVAEWSQAQTQDAAALHYNTDPATYQKNLSASAADLIAKMGGDDFAEEALTKALAPSMQRLSAAQTAQHAQWTETETMNSYTSSLILSGQYASQDYDGSATGANGPQQAAVNAGGDYKAFATQVSNTLIGAESGNNENAQNPDSSAGGVGQFIDSTWLTTVKKYRPTLAAGKSNAEILALKKGPGSAKLGREMSIEYTAEGARGLAATGHPVTAGTSYLAYFAGLGGARKVLSGNPTADVSTTLTPSQIKANKSVMYRNGRLITNAELVAWADKKMGSAPSGNAQVQAAVLTNPGLPPEKHKDAVVGALVTSLMAGDGSLFQNVGGMQGLAGLNLNPVQLMKVQRAQKAFTDERQNDYSMEYERARHNILEEAASGDFTEDEMFAKLAEVNGTFGRSEDSMRILHTKMQDTMTKELKTDELDRWDDPEMQLELMKVKNQVLDGDLTPEEAMADILAMGEHAGADIEATEKAVAIIMSAQDRVLAEERALIKTTTAAGRKAAKDTANAKSMLSRNVLGEGSKAEQAAGLLVLEETLLEDLSQSGLPPEEMASKASEMIAKAMVQNDLVDPKRASAIRAAMANPMGEDGLPTPEAITAMAFYMDLKEGANAPPEYMTRFFAGNERTHEFMLTSEEHMQGDAAMDQAMIKAFAQVNDPVTQARLQETIKRIDNGEIQQTVKEEIIDNSGLANTSLNRFLNILRPSWRDERLDDEGVARIMSDAGMDLVIESETRSAAALYPQASSKTIAKIVAGQVADRGTIMGDSFVMAPTGTDMRRVLGVNAHGPQVANRAVTAFVTANGEDLFGKAVWADIGPSLIAGTNTPSFTVDLIGENLVLTPASAEFAGLESLPEAQSVVVRATDVGGWYNENQFKTSSVLNPIVDYFAGNNLVDPMDLHDDAKARRGLGRSNFISDGTEPPLN